MSYGSAPSPHSDNSYTQVNDEDLALDEECLLLDPDSLIFSDKDDASSAVPPPCPCHSVPKGSCPDFISQQIELVLQIRRSGKHVPNMDGARIHLPNTSINPKAWEQFPDSYYDKQALLSAFTYGWDISFISPPLPNDAKRNLQSAYDFPNYVDEYIRTELSHATLVGPLPANLPFETFASPLGTVPKPHSSKRRCIVDCSQRRNGSMLGINNWISSDVHRGKEAKIRLPTVDHIVSSVHNLRSRHPGKPLHIWKFDFSRYYRQFYVDPGQTPYLCVEWEGKRYLNLSFSFGNKAASNCAQRTSQAVAWFFRTQVPPSPGEVNSGRSCHCPHACQCGDNECWPYIDDNICVCLAEHSQFLFDAFQRLVHNLSLLPSTTPGHICKPSHVCICLGIELDLWFNIRSLPDDKLDEVCQLVQSWLAKSSATRQELARLCGKLLYCTRVIPPGRLQMARILDTKRLADASPSPVSLDIELKKDLLWWHKSIRAWNGKSILHFPHTGDVAVDASSNGWTGKQPGLGAYNFRTNEYFACGVPPHLLDWHIADLELAVFLLAVMVWGPTWEGHAVSILTDNESVRLFLKNGRSRPPRQNLMRRHMGRLITSLQLEGNFRVHAERISTTQNVLADCLSRLHEPEKFDLFYNICSSFGVQPVHRELPPGIFDFSM